MSYDVSIYDAEFLSSALERGLGDWTGAPKLTDDAVAGIRQLLLGSGFEPVEHPAGFADFLISEGVQPSQDYELHAERAAALVEIFANSVALSILPGPPPEQSIAYISQLAAAMASFGELMAYDPQTGEIIAGAA